MTCAPASAHALEGPSAVLRLHRGVPSVIPSHGRAVAIGNFDGVHRGHRRLLECTVRDARERGLTPCVISFEPHPRGLLTGTEPDRISTLRDKALGLAECGVEEFFILPFTRELAQASARSFAELLASSFGARRITVGENFRFGAGAQGTVGLLREWGRDLGFSVLGEPLVKDAGEKVSSTHLREALGAGDFDLARSLLGRPYAVTGRVAHGAALGRTLGFPTLNQFVLPPGCRARPALRGVFAVTVRLQGVEGEIPGVASLGCKPTVSREKRWNLETHLFDWSGDAYGRLAQVTFRAKLRDEKKFSGLDELRAAIRADCLRAREILACPRG